MPVGGDLNKLDPSRFGEDPREWPEQLVVAATVFGEARGEAMEGKLAVAIVIRNRVESSIRWWGSSWKTVCLKRWQFSCWLEEDVNFKKCLYPLAYAPESIWLDCLVAARLIMDPVIFAETRLDGAHSYYDISLDRPGRRPPSWTRKYRYVDQIGRLKLYA